MAPVDTAIHEILLDAIHRRRLIRFLFDGKERTAEPHDYGVQNGVTRLLAYQTGGQSSGRLPGWRWFDVTRTSNLSLLDQPFPGNRPSPTGKHHQWDTVFARVSQR
ncbi:MAG TPA: WYL domain-containing protein [Verrucomicrobiae bacterium]|nr:WYL domain-containing protein [Verrucomicrobiae bacterium]